MLNHLCDNFTGYDIEARQEEEGFVCGKGVHLGQSSDVKEQVPGREFQKVLWDCGSGKGARQGWGPRQGHFGR